MSHNGETMRVDLAPMETGPDSGITAYDHTIDSLVYTIYFGTSDVADLKLPGSGKALGSSVGVRAPGWNAVSAGQRFLVNGVDYGHGEPGNLGCFAMAPRGPRHVCLAGWTTTQRPLQPTPSLVSTDLPNDVRFA
jgi:hypothetical protein